MERRRSTSYALVAGTLAFVMGCSGASEEKILEDFFRASRLRDNATLGNFATTSFDPRTDGVVQDFDVVSVSEDRRRPLPLRQYAEALETADLVITGEGRADEQTLQGKTAMGVATLARPRGTPVALLCGALGERAEALDAATSLAVVQPIIDRPMSLADAMADTERLLQAGAARLARSIGMGLELAVAR